LNQGVCEALKEIALDRENQIEFILDHFENPRHYGEMSDADAEVEGGNPGCGDLITIYIKIQDDGLEKISFVGEGCTISMASASILTELVQGMTVEELNALDHQAIVDVLGEESVNTRPRCATLSLDVLKAALKEYRKKQILGQSAP